MKNKKGFTLIELLITSGIIAVLFSMSILSYKKYQEKQEEVKTSYETILEDINLEEVNIDEILEELEKIEEVEVN